MELGLDLDWSWNKQGSPAASGPFCPRCSWPMQIQQLNAKRSRAPSRGWLYMALSLVLAMGTGLVFVLLGPEAMQAGREGVAPPAAAAMWS